jgi:hypothetical protein
VDHLVVPAFHRVDEIVHVAEALAHFRADARIVGLIHRRADGGDHRINLALLAALRDLAGHLPHVGLGHEVIAPVAQHGHTGDQLPVQQFLDRIGHVAARHAQLVRNIFRRQRTFGQEQQGLDLRHRAVDAPLPAQIAPAQHEGFDRRGELARIVINFCHDRNICSNCSIVKPVQSARPCSGPGLHFTS